MGVGSNGAGLPETLFVLFRLANRRSGAPPAWCRSRLIREIVELRRLGFRFIALADDNFYPVTLTDLAQAKRRANDSRLRELEALRADHGQRTIAPRQRLSPRFSLSPSGRSRR